MQRSIALTLMLTFAGVLLACGSSGGSTTPTVVDPGTLAANFALADVNPSSATGGQDVAVRDQMGKVSAWYFGVAT